MSRASLICTVILDASSWRDANHVTKVPYLSFLHTSDE
jgi:hypothetical protein